MKTVVFTDRMPGIAGKRRDYPDAVADDMIARGLATEDGAEAAPEAPVSHRGKAAVAAPRRGRRKA